MTVVFCRILVPISLPTMIAASPADRVIQIQKVLKDFYGTSWALITDWVVTFAGLLPVALQTKVIGTGLRAGPAGFSSFPGNTDLLHLEGKEGLGVIASFGTAAAQGKNTLEYHHKCLASPILKQGLTVLQDQWF